MRPFLSICMIVKDEEAVLGRALTSAAGIGAELVVVDTGSTDATVAIARAAGASVHEFPWIDDFAAARNFAFGKATGEWLLVLDADEELPPDFRASVARVLAGTKATALEVRVTSLDDRGSEQTTSASLRFVRNGLGYAYEGRVHELLNPSILRRGGIIAHTDELRFYHHGYTAEESARKDRRGRNVKLLEAAMAAAPNEPRYWHYLGIEYQALGDPSRAASMFDRVLANAPEHDLAGWSASMLCGILDADGDRGTAMTVGKMGFRRDLARISCFARVGRIALREGDTALAQWCAGEIERAPEDPMTARAAGLEVAAGLRIAARVALEPALPKTRDHVLAVHQKYPRNGAIGELLVQVCEAIEGKGRGVFDAIRRADNARVVIGAAMGAFFQRRAYAQCLELGEKTGVRNGPFAFALAKQGRLDDARRALVEFGDSGAAHALVFGLAHDDAAAVEHGLARSTPGHRDAIARVQVKTKVATRDAWIVRGLLECAVAMQENDLAATLASCLPWTPGERIAHRALVTFDAGDPMAALALALEAPTELAAFEVIGLVAHAHADWPAAATMLSMRAKAGDASIRVYLRAADALSRVGRRDDAAAMLALGREERPLARAFSPPAATSKLVKTGAKRSGATAR